MYLYLKKPVLNFRVYRKLWYCPSNLSLKLHTWMRFLGQAAFIWWALLSIVSFCTLFPPSSYELKGKEFLMGLCFPLCPFSTGEMFSSLLKDSNDDPVTRWPLCKWERQFLTRMRVMREWEIFIVSPYIANKYGKKIWCLSFWTC